MTHHRVANHVQLRERMSDHESETQPDTDREQDHRERRAAERA